MNTWVVVFGLLYLLLLFLIANRAERLKKDNKWIRHPWLHTFAMAVYCTTWTYYGGVGRASQGGIDFLTIYIGPTLMLAISYGMMQKIFKISKQLHIASIADFISVRFGKSSTLGALVTVCCIFGLVPYIALQLKAIVSSLEVFNHADLIEEIKPASNLNSIALITTIVIAAFSILYGARKLDTSEKHPGLMAVIAFESLFKLLVLLVVGGFIIFGVFDGLGDMVAKVGATQDLSKLFTLKDSGGYMNWMTMLCLSSFAIVLLPRQFHINFVENDSSTNLKHSSWSFPTYLILMNIVVLPIALCGMYLFQGTEVLPDTYVLAIPIKLKSYALAVFTWLGGLSAATGMIIMETIALSIMVSNNIVIPLFLTSYTVRKGEAQNNLKRILLIRRLSIIAILLSALIFYVFFAPRTSLVSIGLLSFAAVANFAPALFAGLYFKDANKKGVIAGLCIGFSVWMYTALVPQLAGSFLIPKSVLQTGLFGLSFLKPNALFGLQALPPLAHSLFWSLGLNILTLVLVSMFTKKTLQESYFSELYVANDKYDQELNIDMAWKGRAQLKDLYQVLGSFIGLHKAEGLINKYAEKNEIDIDPHEPAHNRLVAFTERLLGGVIGATAARSLIKRSTLEEEISYREMYAIIQENQKVREFNRELMKKSAELQKAGLALKKANDELNKADQVKNEFLYTVTHELKTPLTSIIALSEIVLDNPDLDDATKEMYLQSTINEANRLAHLINQVLRIEKFEAGKQRLNLSQVDLRELIKEVAITLEGSVQAKALALELQLTNAMMLLSCDRDMIKQVLVNLLGNALKYTKTKIIVHTHFTEDEWQVWVSDDGKGIDPAEKELIFDKFFQAQHQSLRKPEGSGLGLAISKKIIDLHNGRIWADTSYAAGAHIAFSLPAHFETNE